jgi:opacity protein-like surface antigen
MKKMDKALTTAAALLAGLASSSALAVDGISIQGGVGAGSSSGEGTEMVRVALQWDWNRRWFQRTNWHVGGFWDVGAGYWRRDALPGQNEDLFEIGLTPVFRLQQNGLAGPYAEAGVGAHLLSRTSLGDKRFSTQFQFGSHLGFGYRFGAGQAVDLSYSYQHLSNADIKKPNNGIDFHQIRLQYHF